MSRCLWQVGASPGSWGAVMVFIFSSRRRHTMFGCDWSSDVCSSDLSVAFQLPVCSPPRGRRRPLHGAYRRPPPSADWQFGAPRLLPSLWPRQCSISLSCPVTRSEEHTSELQSQSNLVCRLLLENKHI